jgi:hypothetical protein
MALTVSYFEPFATLITQDKPNEKMFTGIVKKENDQKHLLNIFCDILNGNLYKINNLDLERSILSLVISGHHVYNVFIEAFDINTMNIKIQLQELIENNKYNNKLFFELYNKYSLNSRTLREVTKFVDQYYKPDITQKNKNLFHIIKNYIFYRNVLSEKYNKDGKQFYFVEYIVQNLQKENIDEMLAVIKFFNFMEVLSHSLKEKDIVSHYFVKNAITVPSTTMNIISQDIVFKFVSEIDTYVKNVVNGIITTENDKQETEKVIDYIKYCVKFGDKTLFLMNYMKYLQDRIVNRVTNEKIENILLDAIDFNSDKDLWLKMKFIISDSEASKIFQEKYQFIKIVLKENKYRDIDFSNTKNVKILLMRKYAWSDSKYDVKKFITHIPQPLEVEVYHHILDKVYESIHNREKDPILKETKRERNIQLNYEESSGVFEMTFDKKYKFKATLLQIMLMGFINNCEGYVSAEQIADNMNISLKDINLTLNSLILSKLITKINTENPQNVKQIKFLINNDFNKQDTELDLISMIQLTKDIQSGKIKPKPVFDESVCKAQLFSYVVENNTATLTILTEHLVTNGNKILSNDVTNMMKSYVDSGKVLLNENTYTYVQIDDSDSEEDSDDSELEVNPDKDTKKYVIQTDDIKLDEKKIEESKIEIKSENIELKSTGGFFSDVKLLQDYIKTVNTNFKDSKILAKMIATLLKNSDSNVQTAVIKFNDIKDKFYNDWMEQENIANKPLAQSPNKKSKSPSRSHKW